MFVALDPCGENACSGVHSGPSGRAIKIHKTGERTSYHCGGPARIGGARLVVFGGHLRECFT